MAFLLMCVLAGVLVWLLVARSYVRDYARNEIRQGVSTQVRSIGPVPVLPSGDLVVTEDEINRNIAANPSRYAPLNSPRVTISPAGIRVEFKLLGTTSTYSGTLRAENGRLVVVDGTLGGPAGRVLKASDVSAVVEDQLAAVLARSNLRATGVDLGDGTVTIHTARSG